MDGVPDDPDVTGLHDHTGGWDIVLPFLCVETRGGPFDDRAFTAGVQTGAVYACLRMGVPEVRFPVYPEILSTVDLLAMRYGYLFETPLVEDGWALLYLTRPRK